MFFKLHFYELLNIPGTLICVTCAIQYVEWCFKANHFAQTEQICQDIIKWKKIEDTFIMSTLNVSFISLRIFQLVFTSHVLFSSQRRKGESEAMIESTMRSSSML